MIREKADEIADEFADERALPEERDIKGLKKAVYKQFNFRIGIAQASLDGLYRDALAQLIYDAAIETYKEKEKADRIRMRPVNSNAS